MADSLGKSDQAFRTIGELAGELGVAQHILRYWETRFPQLSPLQRAGNRRYYRPGDVALARRIHQLLNKDGYTIRGVQQLLAKGDPATPEQDDLSPASAIQHEAGRSEGVRIQPESLRAIRDGLAAALSGTAA